MAARKWTRPVNNVDVGAAALQPAPKKQHHEAIPVPEEDDYQSFSAPEEAVPFPDDEFTPVQRMAPSVEGASGGDALFAAASPRKPIQKPTSPVAEQTAAPAHQNVPETKAPAQSAASDAAPVVSADIRTFGRRCVPFSIGRRRRLFYPVSVMDASFTSVMGRLSSL